MNEIDTRPKSSDKPETEPKAKTNHAGRKGGYRRKDAQYEERILMVELLKQLTACINEQTQKVIQMQENHALMQANSKSSAMQTAPKTGRGGKAKTKSKATPSVQPPQQDHSDQSGSPLGRDQRKQLYSLEQSQVIREKILKDYAQLIKYEIVMETAAEQSKEEERKDCPGFQQQQN